MNNDQLLRFATREEWLANRKNSIGSSDAGAILGHGYATQSRYTLWLDKTGQSEVEFDDQTQERFAKGHAAEKYIADLARISHGWEVQFDPDHSMRVSSDMPYVTASLDMFAIVDGKPCVLEAKNLSSWVAKKEWDEAAGKAPLKFSLQVQHQLLVTGWDQGYLVGLNGMDLLTIPVPRHEQIISQMSVAYRKFWHSVENRIEPELDGSNATYSALCENNRPVERQVKHVEDTESELVESYFFAEEMLCEAEKTRNKRRNEVLGLFGDNESLVMPDGSWVSVKNGRGKTRRIKKGR